MLTPENQLGPIACKDLNLQYILPQYVHKKEDICKANVKPWSIFPGSGEILAGESAWLGVGKSGSHKYDIGSHMLIKSFSCSITVFKVILSSMINII